MSCSTAVAPTNKLELTLDEQDVSEVERTPCTTPRGYRAIPLDITPTTWKADLSKCNVCGEACACCALARALVLLLRLLCVCGATHKQVFLIFRLSPRALERARRLAYLPTLHALDLLYYLSPVIAHEGHELVAFRILSHVAKRHRVAIIRGFCAG